MAGPRPRKFADPRLRGKTMEQALQEVKKIEREARGLSDEERVYLDALKKLTNAGLGQQGLGYSVKGSRVHVTPQNMAARRLEIEAERAKVDSNKAAFQEKTRIRASAREVDRKFGLEVSQALHGVNVQTWQELQKILAGVQKSINESLAKAERRIFRKEVAQRLRYQIYEDGILALQTSSFNLWVKENGIVPAFLQDPARMREFDRILHDRVEAAIQEALKEVFWECISKVNKNPIAWPRDYTRLMGTWLGNAMRAGHFKLQGAGVSGWWVKIDFEKIFGGPDLLDPAEHYRALLRDSTEDNVRRVETLPTMKLSDMDLKNENAITRYKYWLAMAQGQKFYYGGYKDYDSARKGMAKGRVRLREKIKTNRVKMKTLADVVAANHRSLNTFDSKETIDAAYAYKDLQRENDRTRIKIKRKPKGFPIPFGEWQRTVQARVAFWNTLGKAPIWWYLEFGQLRWAPTLPAQGLTLKFLNRARTIVDVEVEALLQQELASYDVASADKWGPRSSGKPIHFGRKKGGVQRKGTFLPRDAIPAFNRVLASHDRNAAEAAAILNTFATPTPKIGEWVDPNQVSGQTRMWEGPAYTKLSPKSSYKSIPVGAPARVSKFRSPMAKGQMPIWGGGGGFAFPPRVPEPKRASTKLKKRKPTSS